MNTSLGIGNNDLWSCLILSKITCDGDAFNYCKDDKGKGQEVIDLCSLSIRNIEARCYMNFDVIIGVPYRWLKFENNEHSGRVISCDWKINFCIVVVSYKVRIVLVFPVPIEGYDLWPSYCLGQTGRILELPRYSVSEEDFNAIESQVIVVGGYHSSSRKDYLDAFRNRTVRTQRDGQIEVGSRKCRVSYGGWNHHRNYEGSRQGCRIARKPVPVPSYSRNIRQGKRQNYAKQCESDDPFLMFLDGFSEPHYLLSLALKYSPRTALTASGMDSGLRAFRSCSGAFTMSSDMATIILFIAKGNTLAIDIYGSLTLVPGHQAVDWAGLYGSDDPSNSETAA